MYMDSFQLREQPFRLSPDPDFLYLSKAHSRAKAYMESTIWFTDGFVVITGEIGAGKTTLIETFLRELETDLAAGVPAVGAGAVRLHALQDEEGGTAGHAQYLPDRAVHRAPQGGAHR
jgi:predicted ATPase